MQSLNALYETGKEIFNTGYETCKKRGPGLVSDLFKDMNCLIKATDKEFHQLKQADRKELYENEIKPRITILAGAAVLVIASVALKTLGVIIDSGFMNKYGGVGLTMGLFVGFFAFAGLTMNAIQLQYNIRSPLDKGEEKVAEQAPPPVAGAEQQAK